MSTFTKKHYKAVAEIIKDWLKDNPGIRKQRADSLMKKFVNALKEDNSNFNEIEFINELNQKEAKK